MINPYKKGLTVKELKSLVKDWPEETSTGELTEVWVSTISGFSSPVTEVSELNCREGIGDILLSNIPKPDLQTVNRSTKQFDEGNYMTTSEYLNDLKARQFYGS